MVSINNIKKYYNNRLVLNINSLALEKDKLYALLGHNGSGKTTLLRLLAGIEKPDEGSLSYNIKSEDIAYLPQVPYIFNMSALENVMLGIEGDKHKEKTAIDALNSVGMGDFLHKKAPRLSGGEAARMAIARTLVLNKKLMLLDEPMAAIDIASIKTVECYIKEKLQENCSAAIISTHNPQLALSIADSVIILYKGEIAEMGAACEVINSPKTELAKEYLKNWRLTDA